MIHVEAPFGNGCDEQAEHDALFDMIGRRAAERLFYLLQNSYPSGTEWDRMMGRGKTKVEVFLVKARRENIVDEKGLEAYCHVAGIEYIPRS